VTDDPASFPGRTPHRPSFPRCPPSFPAEARLPPHHAPPGPNRSPFSSHVSSLSRNNGAPFPFFEVSNRSSPLVQSNFLLEGEQSSGTSKKGLFSSFLSHVPPYPDVKGITAFLWIKKQPCSLIGDETASLCPPSSPFPPSLRDDVFFFGRGPAVRLLPLAFPLWQWISSPVFFSPGLGGWPSS